MIRNREDASSSFFLDLAAVLFEKKADVTVVKGIKRAEHELRIGYDVFHYHILISGIRYVASALSRDEQLLSEPVILFEKDDLIIFF